MYNSVGNFENLVRDNYALLGQNLAYIKASSLASAISPKEQELLSSYMSGDLAGNIEQLKRETAEYSRKKATFEAVKKNTASSRNSLATKQSAKYARENLEKLESEIKQLEVKKRDLEAKQKSLVNLQSGKNYDFEIYKKARDLELTPEEKEKVNGIFAVAESLYGRDQYQQKVIEFYEKIRRERVDEKQRKASAEKYGSTKPKYLEPNQTPKNITTDSFASKLSKATTTGIESKR